LLRSHTRNNRKERDEKKKSFHLSTSSNRPLKNKA